MQLKNILNRVEKHKSFVYGTARWVQLKGQDCIEVPIQARRNSRPLCSGCGKPGPGYDRLSARHFEYIPLWGYLVFFLYAMRRVNCRRCGVTVEKVPWAEGKQHQCTRYQWFLARWAKRLPWKQVAQIFGTNWDAVYRAVYMAVLWGLEHRDLSGITAVGVDEIQWLRGHKYLTLVYELGPGTKRLLYVAKDRTKESLRTFFHLLGKTGCAALLYICTDMWQPYLTVIEEMAGHAVNVLDRFHIMKKFNEAIDQVRREEAQRMQKQGYEPVLRHARWCLLKQPANLTQAQATKLDELLNYNLKTVRAYLLREEFQRFWACESPEKAGEFLDDWCKRAMRSRIEPIKKVVGTLRGHRDLLLNWFVAKGQMSSGGVEGMNNHVKVVMRKAYGFRTFDAVELALYHAVGALPEPIFAHKFC